MKIIIITIIALAIFQGISFAFDLMIVPPRQIPYQNILIENNLIYGPTQLLSKMLGDMKIEQINLKESLKQKIVETKLIEKSI